MVGFVVDLGLLKLRSQIDTMAPNRSTASDGFKGDPAHALRVSDHNPETDPPPGNPDNQVDAGDYTHDPQNGADMARISEEIRRSRDRRVRYVIFNRRMFRSYAHNGVPAWTWVEYKGDNPHDKHMHVSVNDVHHDETQDWSIGMDTATEKAMSSRIDAIIDMDPINPYGDNLKPEPNRLAEAINGITAALATVQASMRDLVPILTAMQESLRVLEGAQTAQVWVGEARMELKPQAPDGGA